MTDDQEHARERAEQESHRGEHNELGFRNVSEEAPHDEAGSQGPGPGEPPENEERAEMA